MIKKYITQFLLVVCVFTSCTGNSEKEENQQENSMNKTFLNNVKTIKSELSNQSQELTLAGKVECDPDKVVNFVPLINGVIDRTYFSLGDKVQKGQNMLDIRSTELSALQSEKISLEAELKIAQRDLTTAQGMYDDSMLSEKELFEAQGKLKQAQSALDKVQSDMSVYGVNKGNGSFSIKAQINGFVVVKNASSGSTVSESGDPLFTIADLSTVWIVANVYAGNLQFVQEGMDVEISSLSYPGEIFKGKINSVSQVFDPEEKVLKARIVMQNKELKLKPEMSVVISLKKDGYNKCISIPSDALIFDNNRYYVIVEEAEGKFESREVVLQGHNGKISYIALGLNESENIVIKNQLLIYSGLKDN